MNDLLPKFNGYEQLSYVMVGLVGVFLIAYDASYFGFVFPIEQFSNLTSSIFIILAGYFVGHFIQGLVNSLSHVRGVRHLIPRNKHHDKNAREVELYQSVKEKYRLSADADSDAQAWEIVYLFALSKDASGQVNQINSQYGLYRGWSLTFTLNAFAWIVIMGILGVTTGGVVMLVGSFVLSIIFQRRAARYWDYMGSKVLALYLLYGEGDEGKVL